MIHPAFRVHKLTPMGQDKAQAIANRFQGLLEDLHQLCGSEGRLMALVVTKLEEACFYAKKAMAENDRETD